MVEDRKGLSLKKGFEERISLAEEAGHGQEKVRTYERELKITDSVEREQKTKHQIVLEIEEEEVSTWNINDQQAEDTEHLDTEPTYTEYEAEKTENIVRFEEEELGLGSADWKSVSPPLKKDVLPSKRNIMTPETSHPTRKKVCPPDTEFTSKDEAYKKTPQERKLKEADVTSHYREQRELTKSFGSVHHEETEEETLSPVEDLVKPKVPATSKIVILPKKSEVPKEVSLLKQTESIQVEEVLSERSIYLPHTDTVSPPPKQESTQIFPKITFPRPTTAISTEKDLIPSKKMEFWDKITKTQKSARNNVPLEKPTPEVEEISFKEELVLAASGEVSPPVSVRVPSPKETVSSDEEISLPEDTVLSTKKTSPALPKGVVAPKDVTLPKKPIPKDKTEPLKKKLLPTEQETLPSKKPTSLAQKIITPEVNSSQEARTITTKPPSTTEHEKAKKGTQEFEQTLEKGILLYLGQTSSMSIIKSSSLITFSIVMSPCMVFNNKKWFIR